VDAEEYRLLKGSSEMASFTISRRKRLDNLARSSPTPHYLHGGPASVTDNFGNRDNLRAWSVGARGRVRVASSCGVEGVLTATPVRTDP
jgi:hypothetical protein